MARRKKKSAYQKSKNKVGRPELYEECVKPHLEKIREWVAAGATLEEVADALGIVKSTLCVYKNKYPELKDAFARGRKTVELNIRGALYKKAMGFEYQETRVSARTKEPNGEDGEPVEVVYSETYTRYSPPSETAAAMLLRNIAPEYTDRDKTSTNLRKRELELRERIASANNWLDDEPDSV